MFQDYSYSIKAASRSVIVCLHFILTIASEEDAIGDTNDRNLVAFAALSIVVSIVIAQYLNATEEGKQQKEGGTGHMGTNRCCASCGRAKIDGIKLKKCKSCKAVRYCSVKCRKEHRPTHEAACKERAAELLRDEILFKQPETSHLGDCPICCLPMPLDPTKSMMQPCCGENICQGCVYANSLLDSRERRDLQCPYCRTGYTKSEKLYNERFMKRVAANNPQALMLEGSRHFEKGDYNNAFEYWTKAAKLGDAVAHGFLALIYGEGQGVERNEDRKIHHLEEAAIAGHPVSRYNLGLHELENERYDRAVKHFIIAANLGDDESVHKLKECYKNGHVSRDDFFAALRAYQAVVQETESPQREIAGKFYREEGRKLFGGADFFK